MKKIALSIAALAVSAGAALAADLPSRKGPPVLPPPPPPPPMWTGFYVGLNAGGGWANNNNINTVGGPFFINPAFPAGAGAVANALAFSASNSLTGGNNGGFIGGGQIGYNYQFYNNFVVGIEADIQGVAGSSSTATTAGVVSLAPWGFPNESYASVASARQSIDYFGTVRGRLGWLATPTLLIYGTGGLAYGGVNVNTAFMAQESLGPATYPAVFGGTNFSDTRVGWTAGGGVEWMFWPNWSAKVEYLYYDLGNVTTNGALTQINAVAAPPVVWGAVGTQTTTRFNGNLVRAGLNYHFNWGAPAPVVAKY
ncbi:outer membrane protein [Methylocystis parvus]|uniref:outer membrane protein n=1 Tax=Methylocystis parvus TaxID=134 RepID=UPI003C7328D9